MSSTSIGIQARTVSKIPLGIGAGVLGAVLMAMFAMVAAATYHGVGFFTPMYHIASSLIGPEAMMASMERAGAGDPYHLLMGPALLGLALHLAVGAFFGALFPVVGRLLRVRGGGWVALGPVYGLVVLGVMAFVGLPIVAALFGGGEPIARMPAMAGWWTFSIEHLLFGATLGIVFAVRDEGSS